MEIDKINKIDKNDKINRNNFDYRRIFSENIKSDNNGGDTNPVSIKQIKQQKAEKRKSKEKKYIATFFIQSIICLVIIGSIIIAKYTSPKTFVSVSSALNGLYENNITLSDLNRLIDEKIFGNEALATFFNVNPNNADFDGE